MITRRDWRVRGIQPFSKNNILKEQLSKIIFQIELSFQKSFFKLSPHFRKSVF
jgi:hypothetical protein